MQERIRNTILKFSDIKTEFIEDNTNKKLIKKNLKNLKVQISFLQHERLIHLLITIFFAVLLMTFLILFFIGIDDLFAILSALVFVLEIFYIRHYYLLENGLEKLYNIYDDIYSLL